MNSFKLSIKKLKDFYKTLTVDTLYCIDLNEKRKQILEIPQEQSIEDYLKEEGFLMLARHNNYSKSSIKILKKNNFRDLKINTKLSDKRKDEYLSFIALFKLLTTREIEDYFFNYFSGDPGDLCSYYNSIRRVLNNFNQVNYCKNVENLISTLMLKKEENIIPIHWREYVLTHYLMQPLKIKGKLILYDGLLNLVTDDINVTSIDQAIFLLLKANIYQATIITNGNYSISMNLGNGVMAKLIIREKNNENKFSNGIYRNATSGYSTHKFKLFDYVDLELPRYLWIDQKYIIYVDFVASSLLLNNLNIAQTASVKGTQIKLEEERIQEEEDRRRSEEEENW